MFTDVAQNSIRYISEIDINWLQGVAQHYYDFGSVIYTFIKIFYY